MSPGGQVKSPTAMGGTPHGTTVLVVEDDDALRMLCRVNLELEGYRVTEADTLEAARRAIAAETPAVVLLDVHVGTDDGFELLAELRRERPEVAVALFTSDSKVEPASRSGADDVLAKPFTLDQLSATVRRLSEQSGSGTVQRL